MVSPLLACCHPAASPQQVQVRRPSEFWGTQVPCTFSCKVNSEPYLRQHFPQRVVFINPRHAESRLRNPELLAATGAMHHGLHDAPWAACPSRPLQSCDPRPCRTHTESWVPENSRLVSAAPPPELVPEMFPIRIRKDVSAPIGRENRQRSLKNACDSAK